MFIASPGDVGPEREILESVVSEFNQTWSDSELYELRRRSRSLLDGHTDFLHNDQSVVCIEADVEIEEQVYGC